MADEEQPAQAAAPEEPASGGRSPVLWILVGILGGGVLGGAAAGLVLMQSADPAETAAAAHAAPASDAVAAGGAPAAAPDKTMIGKTHSLDVFIVNINDRERDRYLKVKAELEVGGSQVADEIDNRLPQIRDLVISLLGSKSFEEIRTIEGKNMLREEILLRVNALLTTGKVNRVFFTEFVVQ